MSKALATKNVAAVLLGLGIVLAMSFAFVTSASAQTTTTTTTTNSSSLSTLQAQVQALLAQIAALQGTGTATSGSGACFTFTQNEAPGATGGQVMWIQEFLNGHGFQVSATGAGSPGNESTYFGAKTKAAVIAFQNAHAATVLTPEGLSSGTGNWFAGTRAAANAICAGSTTTTTTTGTGTTVGNGTGITVSASTQPANSLAPANASRVPFTTFTITNTSGAAVTINGINVQRTGLAADAAFNGVELVDQNGLQIGTSRTFNSNHQAEIGTPWTLAAGASMTYTVAANMQNITTEANYAGQVASISVVGVDTSVPVAGTLPITGASQTINASLTIGTATAQRSSYDPLNGRSEPLGTTGLIFSGIRITAGSAEPEKLYSVTWNQTGSVGSNDLANLKTVVNGTSYPVTVDSTGKYYTSTFPGGILIAEGGSVDAYIQGDLVGSDASGRTAEFDIYRQSDVYLVGQTYGYGVTPSANNNFIAASLQSGTSNNIPSWSSGFIGANSVSAQPFFQGAGIYVTAGTLSTVGNAGSVGSQNIAINVPNQPLGGFTTNFTGEAVQVQSLTFTVASSSSGSDQLKSVSVVDGNGNVVAGPVDETLGTSGNNSGTLVFNTSVTFPVGSMTYTLKGTVGSNAANGATYQLATDPNTNWGSPQGQTSGSTVVLPNTTITLSTMTTQSGQLIVSAASTPASTNIAAGSSNFVIANINLDASQSGEDIRLASLPIVVNASSTAANSATTAVLSQLAGDLTNCQLYNNGVALNNQSIGNSNWTSVVGTGAANTGLIYANFIFQNAITIQKGTVTTLALECNISSNIASTAVFSAGVNGSSATYAPSPTGVQSGNSLVLNSTLTVQTGASGTMTPGSATLAATTPTQLSFADVAGGTTGVVVGTFTLQPTSDAVNLQNIGLSLNSNMASSSDVARAYIFNGSTQVGTVNFTGNPTGHFYFATSSISSLNLPQNQQTVLTIKADISQIGAGQAGTDGHEVVINLADAQGVGVSSGSTVHSNIGSASQSGVAIFRSYPTVAASSFLPSNGVSDGRLIAFSITANANGPVGITQLRFSFASSTGMVLSAPALYAYTDSGFSIPAGGTTGGIAGSTAYNTGAGAQATTTMATPLEIPAGTTEYFLLKGTVSPSGTTYNISTTLLGDSNNLAPNTLTAAGVIATGDNFVWSANSTTTQPTTSPDWTNGYSLSGLPSIGLSENRTN